MSTRDISATNITATKAGVVRPIAFIRLDFASGVKRMHTDIGPRTAVHPVHGSEVYLGVGDFGGFSSDIIESIGNAAQGLRLSLTGLDATLISDALNDDYHGRDIDTMFGFDDEDGVLLDDPVNLFSGFMDKVEITLDKGRADMTLICESRQVIAQSAADLRFTDEQLQHDQAGDLAGEYIFRTLDIQLKWGGENIGGGYTGRRRIGPFKENFGR